MKRPPHTPERKKNISRGLLAHHALARITHTAFRHTPQTKKKISQTLKKHHTTPEFRAKMSEIAKKLHQQRKENKYYERKHPKNILDYHSWIMRIRLDNAGRRILASQKHRDGELHSIR